MSQPAWEELRLPAPDEDRLWELFHENSKASRVETGPPNDAVLSRMEAMWEALPFEQYPAVSLPREQASLELSLAEVVRARATPRDMQPCPLSLTALGTILGCAYGVTRDNQETTFPRPFRTVPSAGALYPLELFVHSAHLDGAAVGLYHYHPGRHELRLLREGDQRRQISETLVQPQLALDSALMVFITAMFRRSTFKYGERGYRFVLLEAGHVAQNINLASTALGLGCVNIGGFFDRDVDDWLGFDGLSQSALYLAGIGRPVGRPSPETDLH